MAGSNNSFIAKLLRILIKFGIAGAVIYLLFRGDSGRIVESLRRFDFIWLLPAVVFYALHMIVVAWRWRHLVKMTGIEMPFSAAVSLTMQGNFFSLVIPGGAIGGDVVKMAAVSRRLGDGARTEGAFSVLMDRIIGMLALFVLALILLFPARPLFYGIRIAGLPEKLTGDFLFWLIFLLSLAGLAAGIAVFFYRQLEKLPGVARLLAFCDRHSDGMVSRIEAAIDVYRGNWKTLIRLTVVSIFGVHLMTVVPMFFLLAGNHAPIPILAVVAAVTIGNIAGLIPLFPAGVGGRDVTAVALMLAGGVNGGAADSSQLLYTAIMIVCFLAGGIFFIADPGRKITAAGGTK